MRGPIYLRRSRLPGCAAARHRRPASMPSSYLAKSEQFTAEPSDAVIRRTVGSMIERPLVWSGAYRGWRGLWHCSGQLCPPFGVRRPCPIGGHSVLVPVGWSRSIWRYGPHLECGWGGRLRSARRVACQRDVVGRHFGGTADRKTTSSRKFPEAFATLRRKCSVFWAFRDGQR